MLKKVINALTNFGNKKKDNANPHSGEIKTATAIINFEDAPEPDSKPNNIESSPGIIFSIDKKIFIGVDKSLFIYILPSLENTVTSVGEINELEEITELPEKMNNAAFDSALLDNGYILKIGSKYARLHILDWRVYHEITRTNLIAQHVMTIRYQYPWNP